MKGLFRRAIEVVRLHRRAYLVLNIGYYSLVAFAMVAVASHPEVQALLTQSVLEGFSQGTFADVAAAYAGGNVIEAMLLTFLVNFFLGSLVVLMLPSLLIPFAGVGMGAVRAVLWGLLLAPTTPELRAAMIPHMGTLILEGQGYILAILAAFVLGCAFVSPSSVGATRWLQGYGIGLKKALSLYVLVAAVLAIAAVYEALEVIYLVPLLLPQ
jgi:hypothetical protein